MKVKKITENKYTFYQNGNDYILNLGSILRGEDTTTELLFEEVENVDKLVVNTTCGCTTTERNKVDKNTLSIKVKYSNCDSTFTKVLVCSDNGKDFKIKITGSCR